LLFPELGLDVQAFGGSSMGGSCKKEHEQGRGCRRICWAIAAFLLLPAVSPAQPRPAGPPRGASNGYQWDDRKKENKDTPTIAEGEGDEALLAVLHDLNGTLRAEWMDLRAQEIELLSSKAKRTGGRIQPRAFRWVPNDPRRSSQGSDGSEGSDSEALTYLIDESEGVPSAGVTAEQAQLALVRAAGSWGAVPCLGSGPERRPAPGGDPDLFDAVFGYGELGVPAADVTFAGFLPSGFFDLVAPPGGDVVAFAVTFVFVDQNGEPTDLDRDGYLDAAATEVYFNDRFLWSTEGLPGTFDLETVALHELGHALGIGHVEPLAEAVMNPVYAGTRRELQPLDRANLCVVRGAQGR
jgi:Matrixin